MSTITLRNVKGSALTWEEVDANFTNLNTDKLQSSNAGTTGQILTKTSSGAEWANAAAGGLPLAIVNGTVTTQEFTTLNVSALTERTLAHSWAETYDPNNLVTVSGDTVTITSAGTYLIEYLNDYNTRWYATEGITGSSVVPQGTIKLYNASTSTSLANFVWGSERHVTITGIEFEMYAGQVALQKIITISSSTNITLRIAINKGSDSWTNLKYVYASGNSRQMKITKLS